MKTWMIALLALLSAAVSIGQLGCIQVDLDDDGSGQVEPDDKKEFDD